MTRAEWRAAYRFARQVRRLWDAFRLRLPEPPEFVLAAEMPALSATFCHYDALRDRPGRWDVERRRKGESTLRLRHLSQRVHLP